MEIFQFAGAIMGYFLKGSSLVKGKKLCLCLDRDLLSKGENDQNLNILPYNYTTNKHEIN